MATEDVCRVWLVGVACEEDCRTSSAVMFCFREHGLPLESLVLGGWWWLTAGLGH